MSKQIKAIENKKKQIEKLNRDIQELEKDLYKETNKTEWLYIPELKIEVQTKVHHLNKTLAEAMKDLRKGEAVITYEQLQWLRNSKYANQLNLINTWEFVYPNPDKISSDNGYVARFNADSDWSYLGCGRDPQNSGASLGVRFVRKKFKGGKIKWAG